MTRRSPWVRRVEMLLWAAGVTLLGIASGDAAYRWKYQEEQESALFSATAVQEHAAKESEGALASPTPKEPRRYGPFEPAGPPAPPSSALKELPIVQSARGEERPRAVPRTRAKAADPLAVGRIEIPRLGVAAIIREGTDEKTLDRAVGLFPAGARPGGAGNTVLAAHRDTFFRPLRRIRVDDRIRVVVPPNEYEYRVESLRVVSPAETSVLRSKGVEELTLVTCYPFRWIGPAPNRFIVSATRVN